MKGRIYSEARAAARADRQANAVGREVIGVWCDV
jgi:hypothetical protein